MNIEPAASASLAWSRYEGIGATLRNQDVVWSRALGSIIEMPATTTGVSTDTQANTKTASSEIVCPTEARLSTAPGSS
jgi:hypothetical protein